MNRDRERIEELHRADEEASKRRDFATLATLLTDDAVLLPPGSRMIRGREALERNFAVAARAPVTGDVEEYRFDWQEIEVCGAYAFEWGLVYGRERDRATGRVSAEAYQLMRILQRQPDGAWKVHRSIWNEAAAERPREDPVS
ncbi:MAG TPA: DUF4440 domain-containing protein [Gemmatimonadales bacterium]|nr:DUF4440 domain-containing protein [Gemmatimonadales bacterium]